MPTTPAPESHLESATVDDMARASLKVPAYRVDYGKSRRRIRQNQEAGTPPKGVRAAARRIKETQQDKA